MVAQIRFSCGQHQWFGFMEDEKLPLERRLALDLEFPPSVNERSEWRELTPSLGASSPFPFPYSKSVPRFRFFYPQSPEAPGFSLRWASYQGQMQFWNKTTQHTTTLIKQQPCHLINLQRPIQSTIQIPSSLQNRDAEQILM